MAIQFHLVQDTGAEFPEAYARVCSGDFCETIMNYTVKSWINEQAWMDKKKPIDVDNFSFSLEDAKVSPFDVYSHLMSQEKYKTAVTV